MSRFHSYINTAKKLIETYRGDIPFAVFIRQFFASNKKYGSKDRRQISSLCYNYFRLGNAAANLPLEDKIILAFFLCGKEPSEMMEKLNPDWNSQVTQPLEIKLSITGQDFSLTDIFPYTDDLSQAIEPEQFCRSFLLQPDLFIRIRPHTRATTLKKLEKSKLSYQVVNEDGVRMPPSTNLEDHFIIDKEVVIQDLNSQQVLNFLKDEQVQTGFKGSQTKEGIAIWDCCAASGGKSILLTDIFHKRIDLTISDIRASIVLNLHQRFIKAGIKQYKYFISDVSDPDFTPIASDFDLIVCDAPCTGSGTWSRTPEQLCFFNKASIAAYSKLQKKIVSNVLPHLQTNGLFVYITCSVFKAENEHIAAFITGKFNCKLLYQQQLIGYLQKADTMFVAVFRKLPGEELVDHV